MDQQLLAYVTTARLRSFSEAARVLYLTQPAVSQHVRNLERALGVRLLERNSRQVALTAAGVLVYEQGGEILRQYDQMRQRV
ncbi:MAG: LysR family transcriptional regulator, partial [Firmicutes bacterium]|nr:LysR family transcriptional regulator [Bacillota bacterium]